MLATPKDKGTKRNASPSPLAAESVAACDLEGLSSASANRSGEGRVPTDAPLQHVKFYKNVDILKVLAGDPLGRKQNGVRPLVDSILQSYH